MMKKALAVVVLAGTLTLATPALASADSAATPQQPNSLLGSLAGRDDSVVSNLLQSNNGNILQTLGAGLSSLTSDCDTVLGPLTGYQDGVLTSSLLKQGALLGSLTDPYSGSLSNLTYPAFVGMCGQAGAGG